MRRAIYNCSWCLLRASFTVYFRLRGMGARNVPRSGAVLVAANHTSMFDPLFVGLATRRVLHFMARRSLFKNPIFGRVIALHNAIPVNREGVSKEAMRIVLDKLALGEGFLVFPEGTRSDTEEMGRFKGGVIRLAQLSGAPIVPCLVLGGSRALGRGMLVPRPLRVTTYFGAPMHFPADEDPEAGAARLREAMLALAPARK